MTSSGRPAIQNGVGWASLASADLLLSLRAPRGWEAAAQDEFRLALYGDQMEPAGYRPSLRIVLGRPEEPGEAWFEAYWAAAPRHLEQTVPGFELLGTDSHMSSSLALVRVIRFRQHPADTLDALATSQLQAYVWVADDRMYLIDATTRLANESRDMPLFFGIVASMRVLPPPVFNPPSRQSS